MTRADRIVEEMMSSDDMDSLIFGYQDRLRDGDHRLAACLEAIAIDRCGDTDARRLAMESLAGAESEDLESRVAAIVSRLMKDNDSDIRFSAVAAAGHVPRFHRFLAPQIWDRADERIEQSSDVRRAANAFLARRPHLSRTEN